MSKPPVAYVWSSGIYGHRHYWVRITDPELNEKFSGLRSAIFLTYAPAQAIANAVKQFAKDRAKKKSKKG